MSRFAPSVDESLRLVAAVCTLLCAALTPGCPEKESAHDSAVDDDAGAAGDCTAIAHSWYDDLPIADGRRSCVQDSDCVLVSSDAVCRGGDGEIKLELRSCGLAIGQEHTADFRKDLALLEEDLCASNQARGCRVSSLCPEDLVPYCMGGECRERSSSGESDGGAPTDTALAAKDAAVASDAGDAPGIADCTTIALEWYDGLPIGGGRRSCVEDSDCVLVSSDAVCRDGDGEILLEFQGCGLAIAQDGADAFQQDLARLEQDLCRTQQASGCRVSSACPLIVPYCMAGECRERTGSAGM